MTLAMSAAWTRRPSKRFIAYDMLSAMPCGLFAVPQRLLIHLENAGAEPAQFMHSTQFLVYSSTASLLPATIKEGTLLNRKKDYNNTAPLKELMTVPPMSPERHAAINRKRIQERRKLEDLRQQKADRNDLF